MIYVHVPFCRSFCTYCDFYSEICRDGDNGIIDKYIRELCDEASSRKDEIAATLDLPTLYIGGGTPSLLSAEQLRRILLALPEGCADREFTIEMNPDDIIRKGEKYIRELIGLGASRFSVGIQALDDGILKWMNRRHDADGARRAFRILRDAGADNISVDLIFGFPGLGKGLLEKELDELASWHPEHISVYQLSLESGSALAALAADGKWEEADEELCSGQYGLICPFLHSQGYRHYEISNWALPGREAVHNSAYWSRHPYVGLGPAAHSLEGEGLRRWNSDSVPDWKPEEEHLDGEEIREEKIMLGLRTDEGVPASLPDAEATDRALRAGLLERCGKRVRIPESHWFTADSIISGLI